MHFHHGNYRNSIITKETLRYAWRGAIEKALGQTSYLAVYFKIMIDCLLQCFYKIHFHSIVWDKFAYSRKNVDTTLVHILIKTVNNVAEIFKLRHS